MAQPTVEVHRVYDDPRGSTGEYRVLADRLWPRGLAKSDLRFDRWAKDLAPSTELRRWYGHDPALFSEFSRRYLDELCEPVATQAADEVLGAAGSQPMVILTATKDVEHSGATVLAAHLRRRRRG